MSDDASTWGFETRQIHAGAVPDPSTGARAVPIYQTTSFQFPDSDVAAARFDLADLGFVYTRIGNPTQGALEARLERARGRRRQPARDPRHARGVVRAGRPDAGHPQPRPVGRPSGVVGLALWRHVQPVPLHAAEGGDRGHVRQRSSRSRRVARRGAAEHEGVVRRDAAEPEERRARHRGRGRRGARRGHPPHGRQHGADSVPDPAARVGRRHRRAQPHEVPRRTREFDRRGDRRRRHVRLRGLGPVPELHRARPELPRSGLLAGARARGVHRQGPGAAAARHRCRDLAVQRVLDPPGHRDAEPAHGTALRQRPGRRRVPRRTQ